MLALGGGAEGAGHVQKLGGLSRYIHPKACRHDLFQLGRKQRLFKSHRLCTVYHGKQGLHRRGQLGQPGQGALIQAGRPLHHRLRDTSLRGRFSAHGRPFLQERDAVGRIRPERVGRAAENHPRRVELGVGHLCRPARRAGDSCLREQRSRARAVRRQAGLHTQGESLPSDRAPQKHVVVQRKRRDQSAKRPIGHRGRKLHGQ